MTDDGSAIVPTSPPTSQATEFVDTPVSNSKKLRPAALLSPDVETSSMHPEPQFETLMTPPRYVLDLRYFYAISVVHEFC